MHAEGERVRAPEPTPLAGKEVPDFFHFLAQNFLWCYVPTRSEIKFFVPEKWNQILGLQNEKEPQGCIHPSFFGGAHFLT